MPSVLRRYTKKLYCDLTHEEMLEAVRELGTILSEEDIELSRQKSLQKDMKLRISNLETRRMEVSGKIMRGREERDVEVEELADYEKGIAVLMRKDSYEPIGTRPLTEEEKQLGLPVGEAEPMDTSGEKPAVVDVSLGAVGGAPISPPQIPYLETGEEQSPSKRRKK